MPHISSDNRLGGVAVLKIIGLVLLISAFLYVMGRLAVPSMCDLLEELFDADAEIIGMDLSPTVPESDISSSRSTS